MKRGFYFFIAILFISVLSIQAQQITTDDTLPLVSLVETNFGQGCVEISNITSTVNGDVNGLSSYGSFEKGDSNFPFENGILLSTGNINSAGNTVNNSPLNEGEDNWLTDPDLENALGLTGTINATAIEFNFISVANQIQFNYLLASEEYLGTNPCSYSDGFAFLIREASSTGPFTNIAIIPGTSIPVNTNTIHDEIVGFCPAENEGFFEGYNLGDTNYNGRTTVLTATATIQPNVEYSIKLVIADQGDEFYDSAVFIEGNSFNAAVDLGPDLVTCGQSVDLDANIENSQASYEWFQNGTPIAGETNPTLEVTESGTYRVEISILLNSTSCVIEDEIEVTLNSEQASGDISDYLICDDPSGDGVEEFNLSTKDAEVQFLLPPSNYNITYHLTSEDAQSGDNPLPNNYQNTTSPQQIFVRTEDLENGCLAYATFNLVVSIPPVLDQPADIIVCDDAVSDGLTMINLDDTTNEVTGGDPNLYVSYHYSQQDANTGDNALFSPYSNINPNETLYIRVYDATTGCTNTTLVDISVTDNPMVDNTENQWISACDQDGDGFEDFDLTSIIESLLQGLTGVTVTFHENAGDAQTGDNPIADPENYQNVIPGLQFVFIRVVDDVTGCFVTIPLELHSNIITTGFGGDVYYVCDDSSADGIEDFDLNEVESDLTNDYDGFEITFYETLEDLNDGVNAIDKSVPYTVSTSPTTVFVTTLNGDCESVLEISLIVSPPIDIQGLGEVDYCDEDTDGFTTLFLETFNSYVTEGVNGSNVKYFLTEQDAINDENFLEPYFYNLSNPQIVWVKVTNSNTGCFDIAPLTINISSAPTANFPTDIIICDDDLDGVYNVDLTTKISEAIPSTSDLNITFYDDYNNAYSGENEIETPESYDTISQYIFIRIESESTGCFTVVYFYAYINTVPEFIPITNFENCEADGNGVADFFFYLKDAEILNGQTGKEVLYFETAQDAIDRTNSIDKYSAYQNTSSPQTIHVRVESFNDIDCFGTSQFELEVGSLPLFNQPSDIFICDDISNDGIASFDLNDKILEISEDIDQDLNISFHPSQYDADQDLNEFPLDFDNFANPQEIYVRIENGTYCHAVVGYNINVIQVPEVNAPSDLVQCDTDYDGVVVFDLTLVEVEILDVRQDDIVISYHESFDGAETDTEIILDPENYTNISNPQTVYIKINNTVSNCYVTLPINLVVDLPPTVIDFQTFQICDNELSEFDLNTINSEVTNEEGTLISYHNTLEDAQNSDNALNTNYTYLTNNDTLFIRLENPITGCWTTYNFDLIVNALPIANIPSTVLACDDISNDGQEVIDLSLQNEEVFGSQPNTEFSVSYFNSEINANDNSSSLPNDYLASNGEIIYVRVENNLTGCYSITQFDVIIYEYPQPAQPIILCDADYDETTTFDLTSSETDLYTSIPDYITISYFENLDDVETNENEITNPTNYSNLSNPQTVYIKAFNALANCYSVVPLDLIVNLPPAINEFGTFEICDNTNTSFDLNTINSIIVNDNTDVLFSYYEDITDAENSTNALSTNYTYSTTADTIYVRVEFGTTTCFYIYAFDLIINPLPIANEPDSLQVCDDDSNDEIETFNLFEQTATVLGSQSESNFTVTYHISENDANAGEEPLSNDFTGENGEIIHVRIENNSTGCYSLTSFELVINPHPNTPSTITNCDDDYDAITTFDLTQVESQLFEIPNPDHIVTYFENLSDLETDSNVISNPDNYTNLENPQTVFVKVYNTVADCYQYESFDLNVNLPPAIDPIESFDICENEDGTTVLSNINSQLLIQTANVIVFYYASESDALDQINPLDDNYVYLTNNDTLFARIEFTTTHCYHIHEFNLTVNPLPIANQPEALEACDDDFDGLYNFDLTQQNPEILGAQDPEDFTITYHTTVEDADTNINSLPNNYDASLFETIYVRLENTQTGCYSLTEFETIVRRKPQVAIPDQVVCIDNLPLIVNADTSFEEDTYLWSTGVISSQIEITEIGTYSVTVTSQYGCETISEFNVIESETATIDVAETIDFSDPNNITITVSGIGNYLYQLDDGIPQESNIFENVTLGYHTITIIDLNGCAEVTKEVVVIDAPKFFTPNGDGYFDTWHIIGVENLPGTIVYIFDRYGKLLKTLTHNSSGWNGIYNAHQMPASDYWFLAKVKKGDINFEVKGHFSLRL
ncbi:T9SS type B sorting domain-containing protein [Psychroserpens sp. Hel_I_66]|uniref:T9SS type B sorting domain-containing protein n=1 Tax=Psychroserpens sp. Hel_I_66 TaxID=1250004 RepID=UPI00068E103B|nr:choice-of-anchor L domain-containing protein [Psychroserpens sp. Hel_I_66]